MDDPATSSSESKQSTIDAKIIGDLDTLKEKLDLCQAMLHPGDGSPAPSLLNNDALLGVIGFLEACAPRMVELVEAAAQGALSEDVLCQCLSVNDQLLKQLMDIDTYSFTESPASTTAAAAPKPSAEDDLDDLLLDNSTQSGPFVNDVVPDKGKTTGEDESFANDLLGLSIVPDPVVDGKMPATYPDVAVPKVEDDFDDFLSGRTNS